MTTLRSRLCAGAALVTGLGMAGIATAAPAQAATIDLEYTCTYTVLNVGEIDGDNAVDVQLDVALPETSQVGDEIDPDVTATVTIPDSRRDALYSLLSVRSIDGPGEEEAAAEDGGLNASSARNEAQFSLSDGTEAQAGSIPLEIPMTEVPDAGDLEVTATGVADAVTLEQAGTYTLTAGDFQGYIRGYNDNGDYTTNVTLDCTLASTDATVGTVTVEEASGPTGPEPTEEPTEPTEEPTEPAEEPTEEAPAEEPTEDAGQPEVPAVVQTDGLTPAAMTRGDDTAALALGGLALAGAGAGTVLVVRRRAAQH